MDGCIKVCKCVHMSGVCPCTNICADASTSKGAPGYGWYCSQAIPPVLFPKSSEARAQCLGPCGAEQAASSSWETGSWNVQSCREQGVPFVPHNPSLPLSQPSQHPGFKVEFGCCRGLVCYLSVPFLAFSLPLELLHLLFSPM